MSCRFCNGTGLMPYPDPATGDLPLCPDCPVPSPPAAPELPEGWRFNPVNGGVFAGHDMVISLLFLRTLLASQGLSIVDAKEQAAFACPACGRLYEDSAPELLPSTLEAHIAELEAQNAQLVQCCKECQLDVLETRIARAVAELEGSQREREPGDDNLEFALRRIRRALEALR